MKAMKTMEKCQGLPNGPCPDKRKDDTVTYRLSDLFLCENCNTERITIEKSLACLDKCPQQLTVAMPTEPTQIELGKGARQKEVTRKEKEKLRCKMCENIFIKENAMLMNCERCEDWFCTKCIKMKKSVYEALSQTGNAHWFCDPCQEPAMVSVMTDKHIEERCENYLKEMTTRVDNIEQEIVTKASIDQVNKIHTRVETLEKVAQDQNPATTRDIKDIVGRLNVLEKTTKDGASYNNPKLQELSKKMETMHTHVQSLKEAEPVLIPKQVQEIARINMQEIQERDRRNKNVIMYKVPESTSEESAERMADDNQKVTAICQQIAVDANPNKTIRLGKKQEGYTRPLRVVLPTEDKKKEILFKARNLKKSEDEMSKNCYVKKDMTKMEMEEDKRLLARRK
jgi:hypothetical protein